MKLSSPAFENGTSIPSTYTCDGANLNPPIFINDVHPKAKSLVLIMDDPDAPGGTWTHWVLWNMPTSTKDIPAGEIPKGAIEGQTSFGQVGYGGPCPHQGMHRYFFKLYALDTLLNVPLTSEANRLEEAMKGHIMGDARLMGTYERKQR